MLIPKHDITPARRTRQEQIEERLEQISENYRNTYKKAVSGKSKAAGILDISRTTLREKMRLYEIEG